MRTLNFDEQMELNRVTYEQVRDQIHRAEPGQYAVIAAGRLLAVTADFDSAMAEVEALHPVPEHYLIFPSNTEPVFDVVDFFWGVLS